LIFFFYIQRYQIARNKKVELEQEFEHIELKSHEAIRRMEAIRTQLEYSQSEEARRTEGKITCLLYSAENSKINSKIVKVN